MVTILKVTHSVCQSGLCPTSHPSPGPWHSRLGLTAKSAVVSHSRGTFTWVFGPLEAQNWQMPFRIGQPWSVHISISVTCLGCLRMPGIPGVVRVVFSFGSAAFLSGTQSCPSSSLKFKWKSSCHFLRFQLFMLFTWFCFLLWCVSLSCQVMTEQEDLVLAVIFSHWCLVCRMTVYWMFIVWRKNLSFTYKFLKVCSKANMFGFLWELPTDLHIKSVINKRSVALFIGSSAFLTELKWDSCLLIICLTNTICATANQVLLWVQWQETRIILLDYVPISLKLTFSVYITCQEGENKNQH